MNIVNKNLEKIVYFAFLVPIITVAVVSISHVTSWYGLTNNSTWATYLSVGVEIAALSALAAISVHMGKTVYIPFGIVTLIQLVGNIFYSYQYIDESSEEFKDWVELSTVFFQYIIDENDIVGHKRLLAIFSGGLLPVISLSFLHMLVKLRDKNNLQDVVNPPTLNDDELEALSKEAGKIEAKEVEEKYTPTEQELDLLETYLDKLTKDKSEPIQPKPRKRGSKPGVTPTLLEDTLLSDESEIEVPKPTTSRKKKLELNNNSEDISRLTYRKRNAGDN
jgi:hypothetical protein